MKHVIKKETIKKSFKSIYKYVIIFIVIVSILFFSLVITAKIPKEKIKQNLEESIEYYKKNPGITTIISRRGYSELHLYADTVLLNIIYCIDSDNPVKSVLWSNFLKEMEADIHNDFIKVVQQDKQPNEQYLRYWHGSMSIIRPLLVFFNMQQIYLGNQILMWLLALILLVIIFKKSKKLAMLYLISMIMIAFPFVSMCLEYSWMFYVMIITSIVALLIEKKGEKGLNILFFITGIISCFLDFLTTELITVLIPVVLVLLIRKEENRLTSFKESLKFVVNSCAIWAVAYIGMWFAKWVLASVILNINALVYVKDNAMLRINGLQGRHITLPEMYWKAIFNNWHNLFPINAIKRHSTLLNIFVSFIIFVLVFIDWKNIKKKWFSLLLLIIALIPYIRFLVLANHSYNHSMFTFRAQMVTVICVGAILLECIDFKKYFDKIKKVFNKLINKLNHKVRFK